MDKLQMTVTLSEPELLAYVRQFSGARERSFMLRMLAMRGLQAGLQNGADGALLPPMASPPIKRVAEPDALQYSSIVTQEREPPDTARPLGRPPLVAPPTATPAGAARSSSMQTADAKKEASDDYFDPLAGLDIDALNDAMARY